MIVAKIKKETLDITRLVVDLSKWLDPVEVVTAITTPSVAVDYSCTPVFADLTPLVVNSSAITGAGSTVTLMLGVGTPGVRYIVEFEVTGGSGRVRTIDVQVGINLPVGATLAPSDLASVGVLGGPLLLFRDPVQSNEAATKHYVDNHAFPDATKLPLTGGTLTGALIGTAATWSGTLTANGSAVFNGPTTFNGANTVGNSHSFGFLDTSGAKASFIAAGNNFQFNGTDASGASLGYFSVPLHSSAPIWRYTIPTAITTTTTLSGSTPLAPSLDVQTNISGNSTVGNSLLNLFANSDTAALTGAVNGFPLLRAIRQFGGAGINGGRQAAYFGLTNNVAIPSGGADQQYNTLLTFYDGLVNAGGTSLVPGFSKGSAVAFYPQTWLHPGATNYSSAVNFEADINVTPTRQQLAVSGTIAAGDVITLTFTSASDITGSPVAVTYTAGTGNTATHIVNGLQAAINANANLQAAGVCGMQTFGLTSSLDINWQTQTSVSVTVGTTGAETLTLGSVVTGASTRSRNGGSIARGNADGQQGSFTDWGFSVSSLDHAPISGGFRTAYQVGGDAVWPVAWNGTIFGAREQLVTNQGVVQAPWSPAKAKYGFDLSNVNFSQASGASIRMPGFMVDGTGVVSLKNATLTTDATGLTLDVVGKIGSGNPTIVSGGGGGSGVLQFNYFVGDIVKDANGGQYLVSAVNNSTGAVTGLTTLVQPSTPTASLGTAIATTGGSGAGLTITPTGVANRVVTLGTTGTAIAAPLLTNAANDAAAATAGVAVGQFYRNGSILMQRAA